MHNKDLWPAIDADQFLLDAVHLFARRPDLAQKLLNKLAAYELRGQPFSVFDHIFAESARAALGAKDYFIPGYRLLCPEEMEAAIGTFEVEAKVVEGTHAADYKSQTVECPKPGDEGVLSARSSDTTSSAMTSRGII